MNARRLTLLLLICSALIGKWLIQPQMGKAKAAHLALQGAQTQHASMLKREEAVQRIPKGSLELAESDAAITSTLARWLRSRRNYGLAFNDVQSLTSKGGQSELPVSALQTVNTATGLKVQTLNVKGQYESIEEFQRFIREQVLGQGASLASVKVQNNSFALVVQVFGR